MPAIQGARCSLVGCLRQRRGRSNPGGKVLFQPRESLIQQVWGSNFYGDRKTVDVHVRWLREKFERFEAIPFRITTVFAVGYRLDQLPRT